MFPNQTDTGHFLCQIGNSGVTSEFRCTEETVPRSKSTVWVGVKGLRLMCVHSDVTRNVRVRSKLGAGFVSL